MAAPVLSSCPDSQMVEILMGASVEVRKRHSGAWGCRRRWGIAMVIKGAHGRVRPVELNFAVS